MCTHRTLLKPHGRAGWTVLIAALLSSISAIAGPKAIEETARIPPPDPTYQWPISYAVDGDWLITTGRKNLDSAGLVDSSAWVHRRQSNGTWTLVGRILQHLIEENGDEPSMEVSADGGVAAILREHSSWIFERSGTTWVQVPSPIVTDGMDVEVQGGTITVSDGHCTWESNSYRKGTNGAWRLVRHTAGAASECENEDIGGDVDVSASTNIVALRGEGPRPSSARIFEGPFGATPTMTELLGTQTSPLLGRPGPVAIDLPSAIAASLPDSGMLVWTRDATGAWNRTGALLRPDNLAHEGGETLRVRSGLAVNGVDDRTYGKLSGSVSVFQRNPNGTYRYAARLFASDRGPEHFFGSFDGADISGRRVLVGAFEALYVFDLPTSLTEKATRQDNFQDGSASDWIQTTNSSFTVATTPTSRVFRQLSDVGLSAATWNGTDWRNQAVVADIKPTAYAAGSGDRWVGLVNRYTNANNYYYVTLRRNNTVQLKKTVNGVVTTLGTANLAVTLNRSYRVRLEAIGTRLRLFVDERLLAEASDTSLSHGFAGVAMFRTKADYDNVLVSANPYTTLARYELVSADDSRENWQSVGTWTRVVLDPVNNDQAYAQTDTTGGARMIGGITTDDQVVSARMRRISAAGTNNWFGLATRFRNAGNYYYVTIRNNNVLALRKLVNGAIVELDTAPFTAVTNTWYQVRFEAVRNQLRVYVNDVLRLEAVDTSHPTGKYGPVMFRTSAQYDDIFAMQP